VGAVLCSSQKVGPEGTEVYWLWVTSGGTRPPPLTRRAGRLATHARCAALSL